MIEKSLEQELAAIAKLLAPNENGFNRMHRACMWGDHEAIQEIIDFCKFKSHQAKMLELVVAPSANSSKKNPLLIAMEKNDAISVEMLLREGMHVPEMMVKLLAPNEDGMTPLHFAARDGKDDIVELITRFSIHSEVQKLLLDTCKVTPPLFLALLNLAHANYKEQPTIFDYSVILIYLVQFLKKRPEDAKQVIDHKRKGMTLMQHAYLAAFNAKSPCISEIILNFIQAICPEFQESKRDFILKTIAFVFDENKSSLAINRLISKEPAISEYSLFEQEADTLTYEKLTKSAMPTQVIPKVQDSLGKVYIPKAMEQMLFDAARMKSISRFHTLANNLA